MPTPNALDRHFGIWFWSSCWAVPIRVKPVFHSSDLINGAIRKEKTLMETLVTAHFQLRDHILWTHNVTEPRPHQLLHPRFKKKVSADDTRETLPPQ